MRIVYHGAEIIAENAAEWAQLLMIEVPEGSTPTFDEANQKVVLTGEAQING